MLDAFDGCCLYDESSRIPEANHGVLGWLLGGAAAQKMAEYSDEELIPAAINSLPFQRDEAKELFREAKIHQIPSIMQTAVKDGMITMTKSLEELVKAGKIDAAAGKE